MGLIENEAKGTENERLQGRRRGKINEKKKEEKYTKNEKTKCGKPMFFAAVSLHFLHTKFFFSALAQKKEEYIYKTNI